MEWYETPPEQRTDSQRQCAQQAYYLVLLSTREGREVVCDMGRRVSELIEGSANETNCAVAQLWLAGFIEDTLTLCGVDNTMQLVEAEARIAKNYIHRAKEKNTPENFSE